MNHILRRTAIYGCTLITTLCLAGMASAGGQPSGVGGDPPDGPYEFDDNNGATVGPVDIIIDPSAPPWIKQFVIPPHIPLDPGVPYAIWEEITILPNPRHPNQVLTDWHEHIHDPIDPPHLSGMFAWGGGHLVIHDPLDPTGAPLVDAPGMMDPSDPAGIWFEFPAVPIPPNGLPVWIHKDIVYTGPPMSTAGVPVYIQVWEFPTVPEPTAMALAGLGCLALVGFGRRRRS